MKNKNKIFLIQKKKRDGNPTKRPKFSEVYEELEAIRKVNPEATLSNPNRMVGDQRSSTLRSTPSSANVRVTLPKLPGAETTIIKAFGNQVKLLKKKFLKLKIILIAQNPMA